MLREPDLLGFPLKAAAQAVKETSLGAGGMKLTVRMEGHTTPTCRCRSSATSKHKDGRGDDAGAGRAGQEARRRHRVAPRPRRIRRRSARDPAADTAGRHHQAEALRPVGLGDEESLSLERMERVGRVALREATRLGVNRLAFAPLIRDQGNSEFATGDVEAAVVRGMLLAPTRNDASRSNGSPGSGRSMGGRSRPAPAYFDDTVVGVKRAIAEAAAGVASRKSNPYMLKK